MRGIIQFFWTLRTHIVASAGELKNSSLPHASTVAPQQIAREPLGNTIQMYCFRRAAQGRIPERAEKRKKFLFFS